MLETPEAVPAVQPANSGKTVLYLSRWLPYPASNGVKQRIFNILKRLHGKGWNIHLVCCYEEGEDYQAAAPYLGQYCQKVEFFPFKPFRPRSVKALAAFLAPWPRFVIATYQAEFASIVRRALVSGGIDVVIASEIDMVPYGRMARKFKIPAIIDDLEVGVIFDKFNKGATFRQRLRRGLTWLKYKGYLKYLAKYFAFITVVSEQDRTFIAPLVSPTRTVIIPNGADLINKKFHPYLAEPRKNRLVFNGSLTFNLNYEAIRYFLREIYPLIRQSEPGLEMLLTGRSEGVEMSGLAAANQGNLHNVKFSNYVEDVTPLITESRACVVPLLEGSGTRLKILECFALGTPVVATSKGAEGLDVTNGGNILLADTPQEFARAVTRLLAEPELARQLAENARDLVENFYDWGPIVERLHLLLLDITTRKVR
ncbi:MAG: glycosyltransferase [Chloroflexi bacterium]|nr:glycosyltransferase [Chloroflexota bacterium]OJW03429.1 MAG: hypothetical protein BGO39_10495 [Chloroflexi bacterium 54-19]